MTVKNLVKIIFLNIIGIALFFSWYPPEHQGFWFQLDKSVFYFFNDLLPQSKVFTYFVAFVNLRAFDSVAFIFMLLIFYGYYRKCNAVGKRRMFCMGIAMLVSAVIAKQCDMEIPIERASPTKFFDQVNLVSQLSGWPAKNRAGDSFPGDHGMMLLIFSGYMLKYFGRKAFLECLAVVVLFSLPRIMGGAHWLTDVIVGSVSIVLVVLSWLLLTPASDKFISWLEPKLPLRFFKDK